MREFIAWVDRRHFISVRGLVVYVTLYMTWEITKWAFTYAHATPLPGLEAAAVIGAVTAPFAALQAAVFGFYMKGKA